MLEQRPKTVAVVMGGDSSESDISLISGRAVCAALRKRQFDVIECVLGQADCPKFWMQQVDAVFIALHGRGGEDGTLQGLLEFLKIPYTGSGVLGCSLSMSKRHAKRVFQQQGIDTPDYIEMTDQCVPETIIDQLGLPLFVKPAQEGSSIGLSRVTSAEALLPAYKAARRYDHAVIAERAVIGKEYTVAILDDQALPSMYIQPANSFFDYDSKYQSKGTLYHVSSGLSHEEETQLQRLALRAFHALGCQQWGRVDCMRDEQSGRFFVIEVNAVPGLGPRGLVPQAAAEKGLSFDALIEKIILGAALKQST